MDLVVRVRASGDSSLTAVFRPLLAASAAAAKGVEANLAGTGKGAVKAAREGAAAVKAAADAQAISIAGIQALRDKDHARFLSQIKAEEAEQKKAATAVGAAHQKAAQQASAALRTFGGLMRSGVGTAKEVGAGFGIDFSMQGGLARGMARNATAIALSNASYKDGGPRESVAGLESQAMATGAKYKLDPTGVIEGLAQYQKLTGDLATEASTARAAEATLTTNLATEASTARAAELVLTNDLAAEVTRATAAEGVLTTDLASGATDTVPRRSVVAPNWIVGRELDTRQIGRAHV